MTPMRIAALLTVSSTLAFESAQAQHADAIDVVEHGVYTADTKDQRRGPDGLLLNAWVNICHVATTTKVRARLQLLFGFRYLVRGAPEGRLVELKEVTLFPTSIQPPGAARPLTRFESRRLRQIGGVYFTGYAFDEPAELVPGRWAVQVWHGVRKLLEQDFDVVADDGERLPGAGGGSCFKAS